MSTLHIAIFFYTLTQKQLICLSSCNWGPWISTLIWDMLAIFGGIDAANNHSHISKPHPLNNTDTLGGRFPWLAIQPLLNAIGFWNAPPPQSSCPSTSIIYEALFRKELGPLFSPPFCYQCGLWFEPYWGLEIEMLGRPRR